MKNSEDDEKADFLALLKIELEKEKYPSGTHDLTARLEALASALEDEAPIPITIEENDSLVYHIQEAKIARVGR